ncbi:MAG: hypothetical protein KUG83_05790 [Gammaproteobacteria bacterium]|nr:hypothetical protein [Gammaproteobacteria bacterium]
MNRIASYFSMAALLTLASGISSADVEFSGFASAGVVGGDLDVPLLSGRDVIGESSSFGADNTVGVQVAANVNDDISVKVQLLGKGTVDSYSISAQWAYISYEVSPSVSVRMGRMSFPAVLFSEYQEIGISYPWVRNPMEVYSVVPLATYSGMDILYAIEGDNMSWAIQPFIGSSPGVQALGATGDAELAFGITVMANTDNGKLSVTVANANEANFTFNLGGIDATLSMDLTYISAGIEYELNNLLLISEVVKKDIRNNPKSDFTSISDMVGYYLMLGYRVGDFLPHFTYAGSKSDHGSAVLPAGSTLPGVPASVYTTPADMIIPSNGELFLQKSYTLGVRYDFSSQSAFKLEYQKIIPDDESWGVYFANPGDSTSILSFAVDVVF